MNYKGKVYNRIILIGSPGSGKSYLSKVIAGYTNIPLVHLDNEYWQPGWVETQSSEWLDKQKEIISGEKWIIDGNYNNTLELRYSASDCIIFLDMNPLLCIYGVFKRHGKKRSDIPDYLEEKKDKEFWEFIKFIWKFSDVHRNSVLDMHNKYPEKEFIVLRNRKEIKGFIKELEKDSILNVK